MINIVLSYFFLMKTETPIARRWKGPCNIMILCKFNIQKTRRNQDLNLIPFLQSLPFGRTRSVFINKIVFIPVTGFPHFLHLRLLQLGPLVVLLLNEPPFLDVEGPEGRAHDQEFGDRVFEAAGSVETLLVDRDVLPAFELVNKLMRMKNIKI